MAGSKNKPTLENILDNLGDGLICVDSSMKIIVFNQTAERLVEVSQLKTIGRDLKEIFKRDLWLHEMLKQTSSQGVCYDEYEETLSRRLSEPLPVGITTSRVFDEKGEPCGAVALIKDLSGIRSLEVETLRKERLALIGSFAAKLAHEIKNPLGGIKGSAQLLERKLSEVSLKDYTNVIIKEADRLNLIVSEILDFTQPRLLKKESINIHRILDEATTLLTLNKDHGSKVKKEYDPSLPEINGDYDRLKQVFLNLIKNAYEAVIINKQESKEKTITLSTRIVTDFHLSLEDSPEAKFVVVEVSDTGDGIPKKNIEKIFTPFFTTKAQGSGLGMTITFEIIKRHGGFIKVESEPDLGTNIRVYLPLRT
ncbi:MAG: PAS domain-containing protein [Deltaproteobacteria bacterium]|nr:PAS domain-containing protein [Deltaproteobacteria bacterium]